MKTTTNLALILHKRCNQRISCNQNKRSRWSNYGLGLLMLFMLLVGSVQVKATVFNPTDHGSGNGSSGHLSVFFDNNGVGTNYSRLLIYILMLDRIWPYDMMRNIDIYILEDDKSETLIFSSGNKATYNTYDFVTPQNSEFTGYISNFNQTNNAAIKTFWFERFYWNYPQRLIGKNITLRFKSSWQENVTGEISNKTYDYPVTLPVYNPAAIGSPTLKTIDGTTHKKWFNYSWTSLDASLLSTNTAINPEATSEKVYFAGTSTFDIYSDELLINKVASYPIPNGNAGNIDLSLSGLNKTNTFYPVMVYNVESKDFYGDKNIYNWIETKKYTKKMTPISHPGYKYPANVTVNPKLDEKDHILKIDLAITEGNASSTLPSKYYIKRNGSYLGEFTGVNYTDATVSPWTDYTYLVYTVPDTWTDKKIVIPELSYTINTSTKPKPISFDGFKFTTFKGTNPYIKIFWDNLQWHPNNNTFKLYRKNSTTGEFTTELAVSNSASSFSDFTDIVENKFYSYKLEINQWGIVTSKIDSVMVSDMAAITKITATKNTFGDRINLQWEIDKLNLCDRFEIWRSFAFTTTKGDEAWSDEVLVNQFTAQSLLNSWDDRDAAPGVLYKYKVVAVKKTATTPAYDLKVNATDIGFRMPVGVVTGRITYGAGTAVKGTSLFVSSSSAGGDRLYKSLKFNGENSQGGKVKLTKAKHGCIADKGFTFQAWVKPLKRQAVSSTIFEVANEYSIRMYSNKIQVHMGSYLYQIRSYTLSSDIAENSYFHLTVAYNLDKKLKIFINGIAKDSVTLTETHTCSFNETTTKSSLANNTAEIEMYRLPYIGYIDDVRLWNKGITNTEVADNFNRYLGGSETGLIGYWPMDEGIGTYAFDCSKTDKVFNESHITEIKGAASDTIVPTKDKLSIKGVTDADGNYIIRGIPFTGDGSTYSITPVMGTHKFEPKQQLRYISPSSLIHNSTDFTDKSSFPVKVNVKYENTDYPVEGVSFYIDDNPVSKENKIVLTDEKGQAEIDVPIGEHYIKASLIGHGFKNNGRFPSIGKIIVDESIQPIDFTDSTLVSITGRVAGGLVENAKPVGFKKGKANIGPATIILKPAQYSDYSLNNTGAAGTSRSLSADSKGKINSKSSIEKGKSDIIIKTDELTGEYFVMLPPIKEWTVSNVAIEPKGVLQSLADNLYTKSIRTNPLVTNSDTINIATNKVDSFKYNVKQNFIYRVEPTINVTDPMAVDGAYGDSTYIIKDKDDPKRNETIKLYTINNGVANYDYIRTSTSTVASPFKKPVFTMGEIYTLKIEAYEEYFDKNMVSNKVPLSGAAVIVKNEMGKIFRSESKTAEAEPIPVHEMKLNSKGYTYYQFLAGFPRFTSPLDGLSMTVDLEYNNADYSWSENGKFRAIVLGYEPIGGSNFITKGPGPLMPLVVLRDPPGTNSYAYLEKGTTISYSLNSKTNINGSFSNKNSLKFGYNTSVGVGLGFMVIVETDTENSTSIGVEGEYSKFTGTSNSKSLTLTEKVQTSSSPEFVGSNADVYIGTSTNVFLTNCNWLEISKVGGVYELNQNIKSTTNIEAATEFRFSQNEILTAQIPAWKKKALDLMTEVSIAEYNNPTVKNENTNRYITLCKPKNNNFDINKLVYKVVPPTSNQKIGDQIDSTLSHVKNWQNLILRNEETKHIALNDKKSLVYDKTNISFDAGAVVERSYNYSTSTGKSHGNSKNTQAVIGTNFGFEIAGNGIDVELEAKFGGGEESETSVGTQSTTSFGYVLSDDDIDNRFSVNVYRNKFLSSELKSLENDTTTADYADASIGSYIFELAAGQTSCPYEGEDSTLFYKGKTTTGEYITNATEPLLVLAAGSQALDVPKMDILPTKVRTDVPNGKEASFTLKLESGSTGYSPRPYVLSVDETTNKDGAIISVDGTPLTAGRPYYISKGQPLTKTLTVRQTKLDVLNYENIKLKFSSECDDIADTKDITVKFVPSCSDLDLVIDSLTMNTETGNSLLLKLRNFNQDYTNFKGIKIQYKLEGAKDWREKLLAKKGASFAAGVIPDSIIPDLKSAMDYRLSFKGLDDGRYQIHAMTICDDPNSSIDINNITPEFIVVKDMVRPASIGTPSPSSGILTPDEEIAVTFNEALQINRLVETDFEVVGVLNGATLQHGQGLALDGISTSQAATETAISLQNSSFAIEGWVQTSDGTTMGNVFSIGEGADKLTLKMNKSSVALYVNDAQVGTTEAITPKSDWQYISLNYDAYTKKTKLFVLNSVENQEKLILTLANGINPAGRFFVGSGFNGKIHQVAVWNSNRNLTDLNDMNTIKSGTENNLVGYWPMDEANGKMAADKVRSRNMMVNSAWFVEPNGKSGVFNGTDKSVQINTSTIPLTASDNFSLECWFAGNEQKDKTIFSCGKGIGDVKPEDKLSVGFDNAGALNVNAKNVSYVIPNVTVLDGNWHHFALSVSRSGNATIFVDGQQRLQIPSTKISGLAADKMTIGSRSYYENQLINNVSTLKFMQDQYFEGKIDEVRIWKTALTSENIRLDMRSKLTSATSGLIAYYPFEKETNANGKIVEASLDDASIIHSSPGTATNMVYSDITPGIKMSRQKVNVNFNYTATDNKIVFTINEPLKRIENCILEFTIKKVLDKNGNELTSPIKWTAFVNNNRLKWESDQVVMTKQVLVAQTFKATIINKSGKYENFVIDGLPTWLSVNKSSGRLNPLEKAELTFTVDAGVNVGSYESRINLTGSNGIQEMLPISIKVTGPRPDWAVNPYDYESSMNVIGKITIEGVGQEDTEDLLAAFIEKKCVGIASPQFDKKLNSYIFYMDVYGKAANDELKIESDAGKEVTFSLWDAGTGRIYPDVEVNGDKILFSSGSIFGSKSLPKVFNATDKVEQQLAIKKGWNWLSTNVMSSNPENSVLTQFEKGMEADGILLKSKSNGFNWYGGGEWDKNIKTLNPVLMYSLLSAQPKTIKLIGATVKASSTPIVLVKRESELKLGWSWIGYIPQFVAPLNEALSGLSANEGDIIKGQMGFAAYSQGEWVGSLQYMVPGLGYMYGSASLDDKSFKYPSQYISRSKVKLKNKEAVNYKWVPGGGGQSMTITAVLKIDNTEMTSTNLQLGAFINDECRGVIEPTLSRGKYVAFLSVWGGGEDMNKKIVFKCYNPSTDKELVSADNSVLYSPDATKGTSLNPYAVSFSSITTDQSDLMNGNRVIYPNPAINTLNFTYNPQGIERLEIVDCTGRTMVLSTAVTTNSINVSDLIPGIYTLRVNYRGTIQSHRFIKK